MKKLVSFIDSFNEMVGRFVSYVVYALLIVVLYEVVSRKIFNKPTIWAFELSYMLYGTMFILGFAYTLKHNMHVGIDVISGRLSPKKQSVLEILSYLVFFFPFMYLAIKSSYSFFYQSWEMREISQSQWAPPIYPFKALIPIGFCLLCLQGVSQFIKAIYKLKGGKI